MTTWRPLRVRNSPTSAQQYDALHDGIPPWLADSIESWVRDAIYILSGGGSPTPVVQRVERMLRYPGPTHALSSPSPQVRVDMLIIRARIQADEMLSVVDALVSQLHGLAGGDAHIVELDGILQEGGSAWTIGVSGNALERRVSEGVRERAQSILGVDARASHHAKRAWTATYGRSPNPSEAYREAVKAVEAAAMPIVSPNDSTATLGRIIGEMRAHRDSWRVAFVPRTLNPVDVLISMMELLWTSQHDRHASGDPDSPLTVAQEQAETAVHLGLTLVHWFSSGAVQRIG